MKNYMKNESSYAHIPWMVLATVAFSLMTLLVKGLSRHLSGLEVVFYRSLSHLAVLGPVLFLGRVSFLRDFSPSVLVRSVLSFFGVALYFISLTKLDASLASLLQWSAPAFTFLYGVFALKERVTLRAALCLLAAFLGVAWAIGTGSGTLGTTCAICLAIGLGGAACAGISYGVLKSAVTKASPESLAAWMSLVSLVGALVELRGHVKWVGGSEFLAVAGIGLLVSLYQSSVAKAYMVAPAVRVAPFSVAPAIVVLLCEAVLAHRAPSANQFWGSILTVASLVTLGLAPKS